MKILMVNKFLHPNGGSETYMFQLGAYLALQGHAVEYFGMEHAGRQVNNSANAYTTDMDFHHASALQKLRYSLKTIYSHEARRQIRKVLDAFTPDVVHLNNFNYQLTPSILLEVRAWSKASDHPVKIVYTAHDYQLLCPNHMLFRPQTQSVCEQCVGGQFLACAKGNCIHESRLKSIVGMLEGYYWKVRKVYGQLDVIICPSRFMKTMLDHHPVFSQKTVALHNFIDRPPTLQDVPKQDYVLYFGRYSIEKGIGTLLEACKALPHVSFVFAGTGPLENTLCDYPNVLNIGFQRGEALVKWIGQAKVSVYPSQWYENCPYSVMESQLYGTPVIGAAIGGIPELIDEGRTGELFESGNATQLAQRIQALLDDPARLEMYTRNCRQMRFLTTQDYYDQLMPLYEGRRTTT